MQPTFTVTRDGSPAAHIAHLTVAWVARNGQPSCRLSYSRLPADQMSDLDFVHFWADAASEAEFRQQVTLYAEHLTEIAALNRVTIDNISTPWGPSHTAREYAPGVVSVTTAGHGGFILAEDINELVDPEWRNAHGHYEEDECWAIVAFTLPHLFTTREAGFARRTLMNSWPDIYARLTGVPIALEDSAELRRRDFMARNAGKWMVRSAIRSKMYPSKVLVTATIDLADPSHGSRQYLVAGERYHAGYANPANFAFVIDEAVDTRVDRHERLLS